MTVRNYALIRNHVIENIIVLDDALPHDPSFALWLTQYDEVTEAPLVAQVANPGQGISPGWKRPAAGQPFAPIPGLYIDGNPYVGQVTIAADGKTSHAIRYFNPQADAPLSVQIALTTPQGTTTRTVNVDPSHNASFTFTAPAAPASLTATAGGLSVTIQAV